MKKWLLTLCVAAGFVQSRADEGMWIPMLIGKNYEDMKRMGLKLSKEDLYSINHSSIKDAVVQFNGGCTAELISGSGLLLTNHHCGYDAIAGLSSVESNYLDNGFWSKSMSEELPAKGLSVIFLERLDDVTPQITAGTESLSGAAWQKKIDENRKAIEKKEAQDGKFVANVREYFNGNQYLLLVYKKYTDVRLVGTPPKSLGKFGGDTDNWMWPRHTADFSMFRIYAGKDNEPAEYSKDNVPYKPKKYLPVSNKGVQEGDFAMIFGYPGRTNRYEVSYGVDLAINEVNPSIVRIRDERLAIMKQHMDKDKAVYLKLTSQYAGIANYWKYFIGQTAQLKNHNVIQQKRDQEAAFEKWSASRAEYKNLMPEYKAVFAAYQPYAKSSVYFGEAFRASVLAKLASATEPLLQALRQEKPKTDSVTYFVNQLKTARTALMKQYDFGTDRDIFAAMTHLYYTDIPASQQPDIYERVIVPKYGKKASDMKEYAAYVYKNTLLLDDTRFNAFCEAPTAAKLQQDPAVEYASSFVKNFNEQFQTKMESYANDRKTMSRKYVKGLLEMDPKTAHYPDANSTMRVTYGAVKSYNPQDAVHYDYFTTLDGLVAKYKDGDDEFDAPKELIALYNAKDYGRYADKDGKLHTCFITTDDITGGNSGSPVINAKGELIGAAFDGNWEAMSGDIAFDKSYKRTIVCDSRYILFLIDKLGHADNLIKEMDIKN